MNMWIVICQAITSACLLTQYTFFYEVDAQDSQTLSASAWFGDLEKKLNGVMHDVFQSIKRSVNISPFRGSPSRRPNTKVRDVPTTRTNDIITEDIGKRYEAVLDVNNKEVYADPPLRTEKKSIIDEMMDDANEKASGISQENSEYPNYHFEAVAVPINQKKKTNQKKKHKKKIKPKRKIKTKKINVVIPRVVQPQVAKPHMERVKIEKSKRESVVKGRKPKPKNKKKPIKFVKTSFDNKINDSNSNESARRGKPVDIIVHIKMND